jgi:hypothetical protein
MRLRRTFPILLGVVLVAAAVAIVVVLRKHAPPEPARLLPGADGFFYVNVKWIRLANVTGQLPAVSHDPEYQQFIEQTGFQFERDLDQAAFAIHYPSSLPKNTDPSGEARFSEVLVGKIDGDKLRDYLHKIASAVEDYNSTSIYSIPLENRILRVAILSVDTVAASNHPDPQVIRGMIDRSRKLASPFGGPALLRQYYKTIPLGSLAWLVLRVDPGESDFPPGALNFSFLFSKPAVVVASARYFGSLHLRADALTASESDAKMVADKLNTFLTLFHSAESSVPGQGTDPDVKQFFDSLKVEQNADHAVLTAVLPPGFIRKAFAEPPKETAPPPSAEQGEKSRSPKHRGKVK